MFAVQAWAVTSSSVLPFPVHEPPPPVVFHPCIPRVVFAVRREFEIQAGRQAATPGRPAAKNIPRMQFALRNKSFETESEPGDDAELFLDDSGGFSFHSG